MAKFTRSIFLFALIIPLISSQCTIDTAKLSLKRAVYDFSVQLVKRIAQETENHFVTSALSPWTLISTVSLGARDETLKEIIDVLRLHRHQCFNKKYYQIIKELTSASDDTVLERSSSLFVDESLQLNEDFRAKIKKFNVSTVESLHFENSDAVAAIINDYVSKATKGNIDEIVSASDIDGVSMALIDAIYFKGTWTNQFDAADTDVSAFYDENLSQIGDVNLMFAQQEARIAKIEQINSEVLELTYGSKERFAMLFFLPDRGVPVSRVTEKLEKVCLKTIFSLLKEPQQVKMQIPRFKITSDLDNMKEYLIDMGLKSMFDSNTARLEGISQYSLSISSFVQKANVEVTEEGTTASAATGAFFEARSMPMPPKEFTLKRPFLFMIVDKQTELPLFTGAYSKPTVY